MEYWSNEASVGERKTLLHYSSLNYSTAPEAQLDGTDKLITLPHPMQFLQFLIRTLLILVVAVFVFSESVVAAIVFKPGKKPDFVMPGEEEISGVLKETAISNVRSKLTRASSNVTPKMPSRLGRSIAPLS